MIQRFSDRDLSRISRLQPEGWQDIVPYFRFYLRAPYCRPLKVESGRKIVALGCVIMHKSTAWLSHIIVAPEMRREGLGLAMTHELIATAERHGRSTQLLIATSMGKPLYELTGFHASCEYLCFQQHPRLGLNAVSGVRRLEPVDITAVVELDNNASGEDRQVLLSGHTHSGWVYECPKGNDVRGFYLPTLGEGLIVAKDADAGLALMAVRQADTRLATTIPAGNRAARQFLRERGLSPTRTLTRMVRSGHDPLEQDMLFNRIGGHVG